MIQKVFEGSLANLVGVQKNVCLLSFSVTHPVCQIIILKTLCDNYAILPIEMHQNAPNPV